MAKRKLERFAAMKTFDHVVEPTMEDIKSGNFHLKGKWRSEFFKNENPIVLELGCGKGEYAVGLAKRYPNKNYIGVDIKGARMFIGAREALNANMQNVGFLRTRIDFIDAFFAENEIDEIWLTFSDPQPAKPRKRLTSELFINRYRKFLKPGGIVHVKTDSDILFEFTEEEIQEKKYTPIQSTWDLYGELIENLDEETREILDIKTHYETLFSAKGFKIKYSKFLIH
ncbi:tRNA (guanosine(46)-N7)-methyltransferase TrmB [Wandonia haliotis]|uniref:tRNA (guanine-N(7)-)-methyltransferase n=1 Tax=Wandonia haliotis TaxID=574963 RepID=A0ABN1MKC4_9FLAO